MERGIGSLQEENYDKTVEINLICIDAVEVVEVVKVVKYRKLNI